MSDVQYEDEFTRLVEGELYGIVCEEEYQQEKFEGVYEFDLEDFPPVVPPPGRTVATDIDSKYVFELVPAAMVAAIEKFCPGHTDVERVQLLGEGAADVELFQCKNAYGEDHLFVFELLEHGYDMQSLSMIGPLDLNDTGLLVPGNGTIAHQLRDMGGLGFIQLFNELTRMRQQYMLELERRSDLMAAATESLLNLDEGLGSITADNLELVSRMLMRM